MFVIGLTGGIGTGKSEASEVLRELGAEIIAADAMGHETYRHGTNAWQEVVEEFGEGVLGPGGEVDRGTLGSLVFGDKRALERLNAIVHPRIRSKTVKRLLALSERGAEVVVIEAALLLEAGWADLADEIWVTVAPEDVVVQRVARRDGLDAAEVRRRIRSQMTQERRLASADAVIDGSAGIVGMRAQVQALWRERVTDRQEA